MKSIAYFSCLAALTLLTFGNSQAQDIPIDFTFDIIRVDSELADQFQEDILAGGHTAALAINRIPDLAKQGRAEKLNTLTMSCNSGSRGDDRTSKKLLQLGEDEMSYPDGIRAEIDPVLSTIGTIDINIALQFNREIKREIHTRKVVTQIYLFPDEPTLMSRWQSKDEVLFAIITGKHNASIDLKEAKRENIYTDVTYYESVTDTNQPLARIVVPARSGNRSKSECILPTLVDVGGTIEYMPRELVVETDTLRRTDSETIELNYNFEYGILPGGNGAKGTRATFYIGKGKDTLTPDQPKRIELNETKLDRNQPRPSDWVADINIIIPKVTDPAEAFAKAKQAQVDAPYEQEIKTAQKKYVEALASRYRKATAAGNQALAAALKNEAADVQSGQELPAVDPTNATLNQLRKIYDGLLSTAESSRDAKLSELKKQFPNQ